MQCAALWRSSLKMGVFLFSGRAGKVIFFVLAHPAMSWARDEGSSCHEPTSCRLIKSEARSDHELSLSLPTSGHCSYRSLHAAE